MHVTTWNFAFCMRLKVKAPLFSVSRGSIPPSTASSAAATGKAKATNAVLDRDKHKTANDIYFLLEGSR